MNCAKCKTAISRGNVCDFCTAVESAAVQLFQLSYSPDQDRWAREAKRKVQFWREHRLIRLADLETWSAENGAPNLSATCANIRSLAVSMRLNPDTVFQASAMEQDDFAANMLARSKHTGLVEMAGKILNAISEPAAGSTTH